MFTFRSIFAVSFAVLSIIASMAQASLSTYVNAPTVNFSFSDYTMAPAQHEFDAYLSTSTGTFIDQSVGFQQSDASPNGYLYFWFYGQKGKPTAVVDNHGQDMTYSTSTLSLEEWAYQSVFDESGAKGIALPSVLAATTLSSADLWSSGNVGIEVNNLVPIGTARGNYTEYTSALYDPTNGMPLSNGGMTYFYGTISQPVEFTGPNSALAASEFAEAFPINSTSAPEPSAIGLLGLSALGLLRRRSASGL